MGTTKFAPRSRDAVREGIVSLTSDGRWGNYHRLDCGEVLHRGEPGVRSVIHGPWRYLAQHWWPCAVCLPPEGDD